MGKKNKNSFFSDEIEAYEMFHRYGFFIPKRIITLESDYSSEDGTEFGVSFNMASNFYKNLEILESISHDPITILFHTIGGDLYEGLGIYDAIKASPCHTTIKVRGPVMSAGPIIMQAAKVRILSPNSSVMIHHGESQPSVSNSFEAFNSSKFDVDLGYRAFKILYEKINEKRDQNNESHMSKQAFENMLLKGKYLFPEEAVAMGLADKIE